MHRFTSKIAAIVAFAAAGFLLAASTLTANGSDIRVERPAQLRDLVQNEANKIDKLENNLSENKWFQRKFNTEFPYVLTKLSFN